MADDDIAWFHGPLSREDAESFIRELGTAGSFLVRESSTSLGDYVLSVLHDDEVAHYQLLRHGEDAFFSIDKEKIFHGLETLIEYHQEDGSGLGTKLTLFCKKDAPPHDTRRHGRTNLLHRATREGNYTVVSELLKSRHRSIEAKNQDGQTAVHLASRAGHDDILLKLLENGANVNCRDTAGHTPLHYACQNNHVSTVRLLVMNGKANVQARNAETGWVPLHDAAAHGHSEVVQVLLSLNVPLRPRTPDGKTPLMLAQPFPDCAQILENYQTTEPNVKKSQWYHGTLDRMEANDILRKHGNHEGSYLVRYSDHHGGNNVLSMVVGDQTYHFQIKFKDNFYFIDDGPLFETIEHVIDYYSRMQDGLPTVLQSPVPPLPKPPVPDFPRHGLFATLPLKKKCGKLINGGDHASTMGRRSSAPMAPVALQPGCIHPSRIKLGAIIGEGEFGSVHKAIYHSDNETVVRIIFVQNAKARNNPALERDIRTALLKNLTNYSKINVAVKTLRDDHIQMNRTDFLREAEVMTSLHHDYIVKLIGLSSGPPLMMIQELVPLGSMLAYMLEFPDRINPNHDLKVWASQIACGMTYLETQKFVHRDLAARNILLASRHQAKISDFGLSRVVSGEYYKASIGGRWPIKWYAPESFNFGSFSHASDVWSYGITLWEMYSLGDQPYGDLKGSEVIKMVENGERLEQPKNCPLDVYAVMQQCWAYEAADRPTFKQLLETFSDSEYINVRQLLLDACVL